MNLPRLRELAKAGKDGTIRPEELKELFEALPEALEVLGKLLGRDFVSVKPCLSRLADPLHIDGYYMPQILADRQ